MKHWKEANLKCLCRNVFSFGNKQEELELPGQSCNITAGTEMWWDRWHDWSALMDSSSEKKTEDCCLCEGAGQVTDAFLWTGKQSSWVLMGHDQRRGGKDGGSLSQITKTGWVVDWVIFKQFEEVSRSDLREIISLTFAQMPDETPRGDLASATHS